MNKIELTIFKKITIIIYIISTYVIFADTPLLQPRSITVDKPPHPNNEAQDSAPAFYEQQKEKNGNLPFGYDKERDRKEKQLKMDNLCHSIVSQDKNQMNALLKDKNIDVNACCPNTDGTPLIKAIEVGDIDTVNTLVNTPGIALNRKDEGVDIITDSVGNGTGITPLMTAIDFGQHEIARLLILTAKQKNQDIGINLQDKRGWTALFYATLNKDIVGVKLLLAEGADPLIKDMNGKQAFDYTHSEEIRMLLLDTALFCESFKGNINNVKLLLAEGADPLLTDNKGKKASDYTQDAEIRELLLNAEKDWFTRQNTVITFNQEAIATK